MALIVFYLEKIAASGHVMTFSLWFPSFFGVTHKTNVSFPVRLPKKRFCVLIDCARRQLASHGSSSRRPFPSFVGKSSTVFRTMLAGWAPSKNWRRVCGVVGRSYRPSVHIRCDSPPPPGGFHRRLIRTRRGRRPSALLFRALSVCLVSEIDKGVEKWFKFFFFFLKLIVPN